VLGQENSYLKNFINIIGLLVKTALIGNVLKDTSLCCFNLELNYPSAGVF
jgi:hypothetical protein